MSNKKFMAVLLSLVFLLLAVSCEKAPERGQTQKPTVATDVSESDVTPKSTSAPKEETTEKFVSMDEARKEISELQGGSYEDIAFPEVIPFFEGSELKTYSVKCYHTDDLEPVKKVLEKTWSDFSMMDFENDDFVELPRGNEKDYKAVSYKHDEDRYVCSVDTDGFFYGAGPDAYLTHNKIEKVYNIEFGDEIDDSEYVLAGGTMKVRDAVSLVETKINDALPEFEKGQFEYKVMLLMVLRNKETGLYDYQIRVGRLVNGVRICTERLIYSTLSTDWGRVFAGDYIEVKILEKDKISFINSTNSAVITETGSSQEIISPYYAVNVIKKEIATVGVNHFDCCGLVYLFGQESVLSSNGTVSAFDPRYGIETDLKPFYFFALKQVQKVDEGGEAYFAYSGVILIDALTGDHYYFEVG